MRKSLPFIISSIFIIFGFLFLNASHVRAASLYFNAGTDTNWNTLANWWTDSSFTIPSGSLPTVSDDVIISGNVVSNTGPAASVNTMTVNGSATTGIPITVANGATFNNLSLNGFTLFGNATFNDSSANSGGDVSGNATFNDSSLNDGGNVASAIFNDLSSNAGVVFGNATFNDSSINYSNVDIDAIFNNLSHNDGSVFGNATFNNLSYNNVFGVVSGNATFNDSTYNINGGTISVNATFNNLSYNDGTVSGDVTFNGSSHNNTNGIVTSDAIFNDSSFNDKGTVSSNATFNDSSYNNGNVVGDATFNNSSYNNPGPDAAVQSNAIFNDLSYNGADVSGNAFFYDSSHEPAAGAAVAGNACFATTATDGNPGSISGAITVCSPVSMPTVTTNSSNVLSFSSANLVGSITDTGGESANTVGFQYGLTTSYGNTASQTGAFVRQTFNNTVINLNCGTYHFRAFATNSAGTSYGSDLTFVANNCSSGGGGVITPPPTCISPKILVNNACVNPVPPPTTCTSPKILVNNVCVSKAPTPPPVVPPTPPVVPKTTPPATTPSTPPSTTATSSSSGGTILPPASSSTNNGSNIFGSVLGAAREVTNNPGVKLVANVAMLVPVAASLIVLAAAILAGMPLANYLLYLFVIFSQILGFTKKPKPWGTAYDSYTKKPLPFARVEILNEQSRKLQSTITDANGRYGFLISNQIQKIQFQAHLAKYNFPAQDEQSVVEQKLYPNIYKGGLVDVRGGQANFDLPMHPREKALVPAFYFGITSVKLNNLLSSAANVLFVVGATFGLSNAIVNPSAMSYSILALIFLTFLVRISGFKLKPFGLTKDTQTNKTLPFGLITLHSQTGERLNFTVSDDQGRYFMLTSKGNYILKAFTPSHISPTRTKELSISTRKGWISREVLL